MDKKNDLVLNMLANPGFSLENFYTVGLNADNTTILDENKYANSQKIQDNPLFKDDSGNFSRSKFHDFYSTAISAYNFMSDDQYNADFAAKARSYHRDDIFAPKEQRRKGPDFSFTKMSNPDAFTSSIITLGKREEGSKTWDELAQTQKVLANPVEAMLADGSIDENKAIWQDSPNDSWFKNFFETRVAAQWDEDGTHIDPITGEETAHKKGDLKTNANGMYYYENLDGRNVYGRRVLNKMNTLTTDGSVWNKYDFFDSDGKDKSTGGTILKNLALCGSMFLPYVGKAIAGASVFNQSVGLLGTLGKMGANLSNEYLGTDFKNLSTLSEMEGWSKSVNRQTAKSEYAQEHMWSLENMIGLIGDVTAQFKEQRFLFETAPIVFKHKYGFVNSNNYKDKLTALEEQAAKLRKTKVADLLQTDTVRAFKTAKESQIIDNALVSKSLDEYVNSYNKIGEVLSKSFMTGITVSDTYGEAIDQGASPLEATWLTLGHAYGEYKILNTGIGEWLFPELRYNKLHQKAIAGALVDVKKASETLGESLAKAGTQEAEKEAKRGFISKVFNIGKQTANDLYTGYKSTGDKTIKAAFFNALGEGTEEVTEELLADFSKQCFNTIEWLRGKDLRLDAWDAGNIDALLERYAMNFVGGFIGGGIAGFNLDNRKAIKALDNMNFDQATQEVLYMCRNGQIDDFLKAVDKMEFLGNKNKSATQMVETANGYEYAAGTEEDNQLVANRKMIHAQVKLFQDILKAEGLDISDESLLNKYTDLIPEFRFAALVNTSTAGNLLQTYNNICAKIVETNAALLQQKQILTTDNKEGNKSADVKEDIANDTKEQLDKAISDLKIRLQHANEDEAKELNKQLSELQKQLSSKSEKSSVVQRLEAELKDLRKQKDEILQGKKTFEFARDAIFEMSEPINNSFIKPSFIRYAEQQEGTTIDKIPENRLAKLKEQWENSNPAEQVHIAAGIFQSIIEKSSGTVLESIEQYKQLLESQQAQELQRLAATIQNDAFQGDDKLQSASDNLTTMAVKLASLFNRSDDYRIAYQEGQQLIKDYREKSIQFQEQLKTIQEDKTLSNEEKKTKVEELNSQVEVAQEEFNQKNIDIDNRLRDAALTRIDDNIESLVSQYTEQGWASTQVKNALISMIKFVQNFYKERKLDESKILPQLDPRKDPEEYTAHKQLLTTYSDNFTKLTTLLTSVNNLNNSPIEALLDQFAISIGSKIKASQVIKLANKTLEKNSSDLTQYSLGEEVRQQLKEALILMDLVANTLQGMKVDNGDLGNLYGYTKTLNQIAHKTGMDNYVDMAEVDSNEAEVFLQDLNGVRSRVAFMLTVLNINQGQKLAEHRRVGVNKNYLFYQKMVNFVNTDDDDWKDIDKLKNIVDNAKTLKENYKTRKLDISREQEREIEKETLAIEDAINTFFKTNIDKVTDAKTFGSFIRKSFGDLYANPTDILNANTETMDDNSFFWWMCTRASVLSTDFHKEFAGIQDDTIAPIPTQELAIYTNYASVMNKSMFIYFYNGLVEAIKEDWAQKSVEERGKVITEQNKNLIQKFANIDSAADEAKDFPFLNVIGPRYAAITFTEGITGSGKTNGVFVQTIKMIKTSAPDLLNNTFYVYAAGSDSKEDQAAARKNAEVNAIKQGLDPEHTTFMSREDYLNTITVDRKKATNEGKGQYKVDQSRITYDGTNIISNSELSNENIPTLVFIDEVTNIDQLDLDDINKHALKNGYSVLAAGDTSQSGVQGCINITDARSLGITFLEIGNVTLQLFPAYFPRSPKQGVSMRTANSQKTRNLAVLQAWQQNPNETIPLHFYMDDEIGITGEICYNHNNWDEYGDPLDEGLKANIDLMVSTLKPGQKIGYVYDNPNTQLYQLLTSDSYKDKVELLPGTTSQGKEGQYYIIEMNTSSYNWVKDIYTAITRSSQASIVVSDDSFNYRNIQDSETHDESLASEAIKRYSQSRTSLLKELTKSGSPVEYTPFVETESKKKEEKKEEKKNEPIELKNNNNVTIKKGHWIIYPVNMSNSIVAKVTDVDAKNKTITTEPIISNMDINKIEEVFDSEDDAKAKLNPQIEEDTQKWLTDNSITSGTKVVKKGEGTQFTFIEAKKVNDEDIIALQDSNSSNTEIPFTEFKSNWGKYVEPSTIASVRAPNGKDITIGSWVSRKREKDGETKGDEIAKVTKIEGNKLITSGDFDECLVADVTNVAINKSGAQSQQRSSKNKYTKPEPEDDDKGHNEDEGDDKLVSDEELHKQIETLNGKLNKLIDHDNPFKENACNVYLYSFNTCELGVGVDSNGYPVQFGDEDQKKYRIDSVNGLMKLKLKDKSRQKHSNRLTVSEYLNIICDLRQVILNTKDRNDINQRIQQILSKYFEISTISCTFGLSTHIDSDTNKSNSEFARATRTQDEKLQFVNNSDQDNSDEAFKARRKTISIVIADGKEDILELPVLTFTNPLTLFKQKKLPLTDSEYTQYEPLNVYNLLTILFDKYKSNNNTLGLAKLIALYLGTDMNRAPKAHNGDSFIEFSDKSWTPVNNLTNLGVSVTSDSRGIDYYNPNYEMRPTYTPIQKIAENKTLHISKIYYAQEDYILDNDGKQIKLSGDATLLQKGRPFVLISTDPDLYNDEKMYDAFIEDLANVSNDTTKTTRVKLVQVVPPSVDLQSYVESLAKVITKQQGAEDIGFKYTAYRVLRKLAESNNLYDLLYTNVTINNAQNYIKAISDMIEESKKFTTEEDERNWLEESISSPSPGAAGERSRYEVFKRFLVDLYYPDMSNTCVKSRKKNTAGELNQDNAKYLNSLSQNIAIRYRAAKDPNGKPLGILHPVKTGKNYTYYNETTGESTPFLINAAVNTNQYIADVSELLDDILDSGKHKDDMQYYIKRHTVSKAASSTNPLNPVKGFIKGETGIDVDNCNSLEEIVNTVNSNSHYSVFASTEPNKVILFKKTDKFSIDHFEDTEGNRVITAPNLDNGSSANLVAVTKDGNKLQAIFAKGQKGALSLEIIENDASSTKTVQITTEVINKIMIAFTTGIAARAATGVCRNIANATTPEDMAEAIHNYQGDALTMLVRLLTTDNKSEVAQLIKDIHDSKQQEQKTACAKTSVKLTQVKNTSSKRTTKKTDNSTKK